MQVLKGPQGTLFGRNTTGGAVLLEPQHPTDRFEGYIDATVGNYGLRRVQGALNIPLIEDMLLVRLAMDSNHRNGFTRDAVTGRDYDDRNYQAYRLGVTIRPADWIENYTVANYSKGHSQGPGVILLAVDPNGFAPSQYDLVGYLAARQNFGIRKTQLNVSNPRTWYKNLAINNTTTFTLTDDITLKNILGYRNVKQSDVYDFDGTPFPIIEKQDDGFPSSGATSDPAVDVLIDELQLQGKSFDNRLKWTAGLYYERRNPATKGQSDHYLVFQDAPAFPSPVEDIYSSQKFDRTKAVYAQLSYEIVPQLTLTAGGRYTWDKRRIVKSDSTPAAPCTPGGPETGNCNIRSSDSFTAPTWNLSLDYQLTSSTLLYGAFRRGYKSGGFSTFAPPGSLNYDAEFVTDFELGVKSGFDLGGVRGQLNADVFRSNFKDQQQQGNILVNGIPQTIVANAGRGVVQGVEVDGALVFGGGFRISGNYSYLDPYYKEFTFGGADLKGFPFYFVARHKYSLNARYSRAIDNVGNLELAVTYAHQSKMFLAGPLTLSDPDPIGGSRSYGLLNLRADLRDIGGQPLDLGLFVTNVTKQNYLVAQVNVYRDLGFSSGLYGEPRMFGMQMRYRFGNTRVRTH